MKKFRLKALVTALAVSSLALTSSFASQAVVDQISSQIEVNYSIIDNHAASNGVDCSGLGADWGSCNMTMLKLKNTGALIDSSDWEIYFHSIRQILKVENEAFKITHITGDLHKLEPTDKFKGFPANAETDISVVVEYWQIFQTDVLPRWYVSSTDAKAKVIKNTDTEDLSAFSSPIPEGQWKRTLDDNNILMTSSSRFDKNADVALVTKENLRGNIIPTPLEVSIHTKNADLSKGITLKLTQTKAHAQALSAEAQQALEQRFEMLGIAINPKGYPISLNHDAAAFSGKMAVSGGYTLAITSKGATVTGFDSAGLFYGVQSILSLISLNDPKEIATLDAKDAPRFEYRGVFLDVGRNFNSKAAVLRLLDQMGAYKLNKFHFHLSDDEGWRIEIPGLPELTDIGSKRCHDLTEMTCLLPQLGSGPNSDNMGSGYFSRADYIEIVKYANARQIEVIPEIDMPAHARAAVVSMEARFQNLSKQGLNEQANEYRLLDPADTSNTTSVQFYDRKSYLNPCLDSSKNFVNKVIKEIAAMHIEAGQALKTWHFGGDEAKNIRFGNGYQDINSAEKVAGKGSIDQSKEDKPWAKSESCQALVKQGIVADVDHLSSYFAIEVSKMVDAHGIEKMQAWQDGLKDAKDSKAFATKRVGVNFWDTVYWGGSDSVNEWANKGFEITISNPDYVYFDFPYEVNPNESGYYWGTRFNDERKVFAFAPNNMPQNAETSVDRDGNNFSSVSDKDWPGAQGISGQTWSEVIRTDYQRDYMFYPRLLSLAERAWHRAPWELDYVKGKEFKGGETTYVDKAQLNKDWVIFANTIGQRELAKLDSAGINYRLPLPGAKLIAGVLETNLALPGLSIEYSLDNKDWLIYNNKAKPTITGDVWVRTVSPDGKRFSRVEKVDKP